jgi:hypothetical protein
MSCTCDVCGCETPSKIFGGLVDSGGKGRCRGCFDKKERGEEKQCSNCLHQAMDMDMDFYCSAVSRPFGLSLVNRPRPTLCAGESGREYKYWARDTRGEK